MLSTETPVPAADSLAAVQRLSAVALSADDAETVHEALIEELRNVLSVELVIFSTPSQDGSFWHGVAVSDTGRETLVHPRDGDPSGVRRVAETGECLNVPDAPASPDLSPQLVERWSVASALFLPLARDGEVREVAGLLSRSPRVFGEADILIASTLANQASVALAALEQRARGQAQADRQTALARAAKALNARLDLRAVLDTLCREVVLALDGDLAGFYLGDGARGGVAVAGHNTPPEWLGYVIEPGRGVGGRVLATGEAQVANAYQVDVDVPDGSGLAGIQTAVAVPLCWSDELKGALSLGFYRPRRITADDLTIARGHRRPRRRRVRELRGVRARPGGGPHRLPHRLPQPRGDPDPDPRGDRARPAARHATHVPDHRHRQLQADQRPPRAPRRRPGPPGRGGCARGGVPPLRPARALRRRRVRRAPARGRRRQAEARRRARASGGRRGGDPRTRAGLPLRASVGAAQWREPLSAAELLARADRALLLAKHQGKDCLAVASAETELELARVEQRSGSPSALMREFWDLVSGSDHPRDWLNTLPFFMRRTLELEEVALYEPDPPGAAPGLRRVARARPAGDPGYSGAFVSLHLDAGGDLHGRIESGAIWRPSLDQLHRALGVTGGLPGAPAGSYAAVALGRGERPGGLLLLRSAAVEFPLAALHLAELLGAQAMTVLLGQSGEGSAGAVAALAAAIDARDDYTHEHSEQVVALACDVARALDLDGREVERIRDGALLHDVGKVAIPNEILYKPGRLTEAEWEIMREHPVIGERILRRTPELAEIAPLVRHEHERWDGGGYPGRAGRRRDPDRAPHHPRLRRLQRDDHRPPLPGPDVARGGARRAAPVRRDAVRPRGGRGVAAAPGRGGYGVEISVALYVSRTPR